MDESKNKQKKKENKEKASSHTCKKDQGGEDYILLVLNKNGRNPWQRWDGF